MIFVEAGFHSYILSTSAKNKKCPCYLIEVQYHEKRYFVVLRQHGDGYVCPALYSLQFVAYDNIIEPSLHFISRRSKKARNRMRPVIEAAKQAVTIKRK